MVDITVFPVRPGKGHFQSSSGPKRFLGSPGARVSEPCAICLDDIRLTRAEAVQMHLPCFGAALVYHIAVQHIFRAQHMGSAENRFPPSSILSERLRGGWRTILKSYFPQIRGTDFNLHQENLSRKSNWKYFAIGGTPWMNFTPKDGMEPKARFC